MNVLAGINTRVRMGVDGADEGFATWGVAESPWQKWVRAYIDAFLHTMNLIPAT